jgi:hypothetical protein
MPQVKVYTLQTAVVLQISSIDGPGDVSIEGCPYIITFRGDACHAYISTCLSQIKTVAI